MLRVGFYCTTVNITTDRMVSRGGDVLGDAARTLVTDYEAQGVKVGEDVKGELAGVTVMELAGVFDMKELRSNSEKAVLLQTWAGNKRTHKPPKTQPVPEDVVGFLKSSLSKDHAQELHAITAEISQHQEAVEARAEARACAKQKRRAARQHQRSQQLHSPPPPGEQMANIPVSSVRYLRHAFYKQTRDSTCDNEEKDHDYEWWKRPACRRDYDKNKRQGLLWTAVMEGAPQRAAEGELVVREEFFKCIMWWQNDKYRREWELTCDVPWWKVTDIHTDYTEGGTLWLRDSPTQSEKKLREEWYGHSTQPVTKTWAAVLEGDTELCSVEEEAERSDYFLSGAWWTEDTYRELFQLLGPKSPPMQCLHKVEIDEGWQAQDCVVTYYQELEAGTDLHTMPLLADLSPETFALRCEWYTNNWWRLARYSQDYYANGTNGTQWRTDAVDSYSPADYKTQQARVQWYEEQLRKWWQAPHVIDDYFQSQELHSDGLYWRQSHSGRSAVVAPTAELRSRQEWYAQFWWMQTKYTEAYHTGSMLWAAPHHVVGGEWWKEAAVVADWKDNMECGGQWSAVGPVSASMGEAAKYPCTLEHAALREQWYLRHTHDGAVGSVDTAPEDVLATRSAWYSEQLTERERRKRVDWYIAAEERAVCINDDDIPDFLAAINEDCDPSAEQARDILDRLQPHTSFTYLQVLRAVLESQFFVSLTPEELQRHYQEELEAQELQELMQREEEAVFMTEASSDYTHSPPASPFHGSPAHATAAALSTGDTDTH
eukprot:TRINITY_DN4009_c0_g1_i2.p1 TRINITY_DN4009_c0_g1~~TRINITY_DN4009_c0_g1_i2.p1  ORF type:complete len:771 (+),score=187.15 TRINITY_DN4009_c0_g1_i2:792-3104(+)